MQRTLPEYSMPTDLEKVLVNNLEIYTGISTKSQRFMRVLNKLKDINQLELAEHHYLQYLKLGLYLEEFQQSSELRKYNLVRKRIERIKTDVSDTFKIHVPGLDKNSQIINPTNFIDVTDCDPIQRDDYILKVIKVLDDYVVASACTQKFFKTHNDKKMYNITFRFFNYSFRCCHYALSLIHKSKISIKTSLFPDKINNSTIRSIDDVHYDWKNKRIGDNLEQKRAIHHIFVKSSFPAPYILFGPPGTGKTATLVEAIYQVWYRIRQRNSSEKILICTPSNAASDVITRRLMECINKTDIYRLYSQSKDYDKIDEDIRRCCSDNNLDLKTLAETCSRKKILITTLCTCTRLILMGFGKSFSYVFIDEASQATQPDSLIPFSMIMSSFSVLGSCSSICQIVISGDPQQLGPGIQSKFAEPILGVSLLDRLMKRKPYQREPVCSGVSRYNPNYITKLRRNYRSHPAIIQISNELFYDNDLIACCDKMNLMKFPIIFDDPDSKNVDLQSKEITSTKSPVRTNGIQRKQKNRLPNLQRLEIASPKSSVSTNGIQRKQNNGLNHLKSNKKVIINFPVIFHGVKGKEEKRYDSTSSFNRAEIERVLHYVRTLVGSYLEGEIIAEKDIGIVTPFSLQSQLLQKSLESNNFRGITVGTVEIFQGQEKKIIIVSTVRTKTFIHDDCEHIGSLSNPKRFNVVLTRAAALLIVIGDPNALRKNDNWRYLMRFCIKNNAFYGITHGQISEINCYSSSNIDYRVKCEKSENLSSSLIDNLKMDDGVERQKTDAPKKIQIVRPLSFTITSNASIGYSTPRRCISPSSGCSYISPSSGCSYISPTRSTTTIESSSKCIVVEILTRFWRYISQKFTN